MSRQAASWRGLATIAGALGVEARTLLKWQRDDGFPMIWQDGDWTLESEALNRWILDPQREEAYRKRRRRTHGR